MPLLLKLLAVKAIGTVVGGILLFSRGGPSIDRLAGAVVHDTLVVESVLKNGFNEGLNEMIMSGTEVVITFNITLFRKGPDGEVTRVVTMPVFHSIRFRPALDEYAVVRGQDTLVFTELTRAQDAAARMRTRIRAVEMLSSEDRLSIRVDAALNTVEIEALKVKEFDLNAFWNYRYPHKVTTWQTLDQLRGKASR